LFGVDHRYVGAPYIDKPAALGSIQLPIRMVTPCVISLAMPALLQLFAAIGAAVLAFVVALLIGSDYSFFAGGLMRVRPQRPLEIAAAAVVARGSGRMRSLELDEDLAVDGLADVADLMANAVADRRVSNVPVAVVANVFDLSRFRHEGEPARRYVNVDVVQIVNVIRRCLARRKFHRPDSHHVVLKQYLRPDVATGFHNLASMK
jgi:hypothetical protein